MRVVLACWDGGNGYDAVIVVICSVDLICVGLYDRWCIHSCDVERLQVGVDSSLAFGLAVGFDVVIDGRNGLVALEGDARGSPGRDG